MNFLLFGKTLFSLFHTKGRKSDFTFLFFLKSWQTLQERIQIYPNLYPGQVALAEPKQMSKGRLDLLCCFFGGSPHLMT